MISMRFLVMLLFLQAIFPHAKSLCENNWCLELAGKSESDQGERMDGYITDENPGGQAYVLIPYTQEIQLKKSFTLEYWIYIQAGRNYRVSNYRRSDGGYELKYMNEGKIIATIGHCNRKVPKYSKGWHYGCPELRDYSITISRELPLEEWVHLAMTFTGRHLRVYINGELQAKERAKKPTYYYYHDLIIGARFEYQIPELIYHRGIYDDLRLWNKALKEKEIKANMKTELSGKEDNLIVYYKFNGLTRNDKIKDYSKAGNHAIFGPNTKLIPSSAPIHLPKNNGLE